MAEDLIRYDILAQDALRGVVRKVLSEVARTGLPGEHHFFVSFATTAPGVRISTRLLAQYPEEMTIVLQHQYWDLILTEEFFEVTVSFNKQQERIKVPFAALSAFVDPSVRFGLQFDRKDKGTVPVEKPAAAPASATPLPAPEKRPSLGAPTNAAPGETKADDAETPAETPEKPADPASKIVKLDSFRKK